MTTKAYKPFPAENCQRIRYLAHLQEQCETERSELFEHRDQVRVEISELSDGQTRRRTELYADLGETIEKIDRLKKTISWCTSELRNTVRKADQQKLEFADPQEGPPDEIFAVKGDADDEADEQDGKPEQGPATLPGDASMFEPGPYTIVPIGAASSTKRVLVTPRNMQELTAAVQQHVHKGFQRITWLANGTGQVLVDGKSVANLVPRDETTPRDYDAADAADVAELEFDHWLERKLIGLGLTSVGKIARRIDDGDDLEGSDVSGLTGPQAAEVRNRVAEWIRQCTPQKSGAEDGGPLRLPGAEPDVGEQKKDKPASTQAKKPARARA